MKNKGIRILAGILFFAGIYWAVLGLAALALFVSGIPFQKSFGDFVISLFTNAWILFGFAVWIGWYLRMGEPDRIKRRKSFWLIAALQNLVFALLWSGMDAVTWWCSIVGGISLLMAFIDENEESNKPEMPTA